MKHLEEIIINYLKSEEPYALQIDGGWGIGKTYYIRNHIEKKLRNELNHVVYFSVYGYDSLNQIKQELLYNILIELSPEKKILTGLSKANKGLKKVADLADVNKLKTISSITNLIFDTLNDLSSSVNGLKLKDGRYLVVLIDDLERVSSNIKIKDLIGFIGTELLEKIGCKVIILSNSFEMIDSEDFQKIKEKTIYRTVQFRYDINDIQKTLLSNSSIQFIKYNDKWITKILKKYHSDEKNPLNIRTLKSVIENYSIVEDFLREEIMETVPEKLSNNIKRSVFLNIYVVTNEYKLQGLKESDLRGLEKLGGRKVFDSTWFDNLEDVVKNIYYKYHNKHISDFDEHIFYSKDISLFVLRGYLGNKNCVREWLDIFTLEETNPGYSLTKLWEFRRYTDGELKKIQEEILNDISTGKYNFNNLLDAYGQFDQFKDMNLLFLDSSCEKVIEDKIIEKYPEILLRERMDFENLISFIHQVNIREKHKDFYNRLKEYDNKLQEDKLNRFIETLFDSSYEEVNIAAEAPLINFKGLVRQLLDINAITTYIVVKDNFSDNLWQLVKSGRIDATSKEDLEDFKNRIKEALNSADLGRIDTFKVEQLVNELETRFLLT